MAKTALNIREQKQVEKAVAHFETNRRHFEALAESLTLQMQKHDELAKHTHFMKHRVKSIESLRRKVTQRAIEAKRSKQHLNIAPDNLFEVVTDLAGIRIIHLHTDQIGAIHAALLDFFDQERLRLVEDPTANCWDGEFESLFAKFGIRSRSRDSMYTTIHYVVEANKRTKITCEVQVRTLMDEVWGEVSHRVNYPEESSSQACRDQLKVLARLTSGCTRLVDSIFKSHGSV
jgi:ppGpp synthetase/RelA/SpoT-type nucleotidyltranferase